MRSHRDTYAYIQIHQNLDQQPLLHNRTDIFNKSMIFRFSLSYLPYYHDLSTIQLIQAMDYSFSSFTPIYDIFPISILKMAAISIESETSL